MVERGIMILEDDAIIAWDIEEELKSRGEIIGGVVGNVAAAMVLIESGSVTVALLDITVGAHNSYGVAKSCQEKGIPVIFLTGNSAFDRPAEMREIEVVTKPINFDLLCRVLCKLHD